MAETNSADQNYLVLDEELLKKYATPASIVLAGLIIALGIFFGARSSGNSSVADYTCDLDTPLSGGCLQQYADDINLKLNKFVDCVDDEKYDDEIAADIAYGDEIGVYGTPSVFFGLKDGDSAKGFYAGAVMSYEDIDELLSYAEEHTLEETQTYWLEKQLKNVEAYRTQIEDYFKGEQGGSLTGEALATQVESVINDQIAEVQNLHNIQSLDIKDAATMGKSDYFLLEYSDYECPYCKQFAQETLTQVKDNYVDNNKVSIVFMDYPLDQIHPSARRAAIAARCAGDQGKYFEYHDKLFGIE